MLTTYRRNIVNLQRHVEEPRPFETFIDHSRRVCGTVNRNLESNTRDNSISQPEMPTVLNDPSHCAAVRSCNLKDRNVNMQLLQRIRGSDIVPKCIDIIQTLFFFDNCWRDNSNLHFRVCAEKRGEEQCNVCVLCYVFCCGNVWAACATRSELTYGRDSIVSSGAARCTKIIHCKCMSIASSVLCLLCSCCRVIVMAWRDARAQVQAVLEPQPHSLESCRSSPPQLARGRGM